MLTARIVTFASRGIAEEESLMDDMLVAVAHTEVEVPAMVA